MSYCSSCGDYSLSWFCPSCECQHCGVLPCVCCNRRDKPELEDSNEI